MTSLVVRLRDAHRRLKAGPRLGSEPADIGIGHADADTLVAARLAYWRDARNMRRLLHHPPTTEMETLMDVIDSGLDAHPDIFAGIPPAEMDALTLLAACHQGMDWDRWGGMHYWAQLTERAHLARIAGPTLSSWWQRMVDEMGIAVHASVRPVVARIVTANDPAVMRALVERTEWIATLLRLCVESRKAARTARTAPLTQQEMF